MLKPPTLCDHMDYTAHGILQARILELVGNLPDPEIKLGSLALQADSLPTELWGKTLKQTVENSSRDGTTRPILAASWEVCMDVKKQQLELDMEQRTGPKLGKEYIKTILSLCLFNLYAEYIMWNAEYIMWNAGLDEAQAGIKIAERNISHLR